MQSSATAVSQNAADLFSYGNIAVNYSSVRVQGRTYSLTGVDGVDIEPPSRLVYVAGALIAACVAPVVLRGGSTPGAIALVAVAAVLLLATLNRPYALILRTARGTQKPLAHPNRKFVQSVKKAIEEALSTRG